MSRRNGKTGPLLRDWHLWVEVKRTVEPLRPDRNEPLLEQPLPIPSAPRPPVFDKGARWLGPSLPSYRPQPSRSRTEPGRVIEPRLRRRLVRGQIEIDGTIDLHGMRQNEARAALARFVAARAARGDRTLLVITGKGLTGKGLTKPDNPEFAERGVLRAMLPLWLSEPDLAPLIAGWDAAAQGHGGHGAFYVRLRRARP